MSSCVWYISKYVVTPAPGEPAGRSFGLMREIAKLGYDCVVVTSDSMGMFNAPEAHRPYEFENIQGMRFCRLRTLKYSGSKSIRRIMSWVDFEWRLLRLPTETLPRPDVIVASSLSLLTVLNGMRLSRQYRCRLVFEVRDIWPLTITAEGGFSRRNPLVLGLGVVEKLGYRQADAIVGTMPNLSEHVHNVTGETLPTYCVPMGVDTKAVESSEPLPADYAATYLPLDKFVVAYAGSIGISNALDVLFDCAQAMEDETDVHFVVVGDGDLRQTYINRYGSLSNLTFAPRVPKSMVHGFLTRCDLLYLSVHDSPVWDYGLSLNKMVDYMLAAKPIVASYSGYHSMINEAGCGTFVPAGDVERLRDEIGRYFRMPAAQRNEIGARGRNWLLDQRDYGVLARDYAQILFPESTDKCEAEPLPDFDASGSA